MRAFFFFGHHRSKTQLKLGKSKFSWKKLIFRVLLTKPISLLRMACPMTKLYIYIYIFMQTAHSCPTPPPEVVPLAYCFTPLPKVKQKSVICFLMHRDGAPDYDYVPTLQEAPLRGYCSGVWILNDSIKTVGFVWNFLRIFQHNFLNYRKIA